VKEKQGKRGTGNTNTIQREIWGLEKKMKEIKLSLDEKLSPTGGRRLGTEAGEGMGRGDGESKGRCSALAFPL